MIIRKGDTQQLSKNFYAFEFFTKAPGVTEHYFDERLITADQIIRDHYDHAVTITSTFRPPAYNASIGGSPKSQHLKGKANDFSFRNTAMQQDYNHQIRTKGPLYHKLKRAGINGFGLYDNFGHIDTRETPAFWDNTKKK